MQRACERTVAHRRGPRKAGLQSEAPRAEEAHARWHSCKKALMLPNNSANTTRTISIDNDFATEPSYLFTFTSKRSLGHPVLTSVAGGDTRLYAGHPRLLHT